MKIKYNIMVVLLAGFFGACQQDEITTFKDDNRIQFGNVSTIGGNYDTSLSDSIQSFTFVYSNSSIVIDTAYFNVFISGGPVDYDRYYSLRQIELDGVANAQPGVHYLAFNGQDTRNLQLIKAGEVEAKCGIVLLRDGSLQDEDVVLNFELMATEEFELGNPDYLTRKLLVSDQLTQPNKWNKTITNYFFGNYSKVKHRFMIDVTGQKWDDEFFTQVMTNYSELLYWKGVVKTALIAYNNEHPDDPLTDENGDLVQFK